jgi:putative endonuclease
MKQPCVYILASQARGTLYIGVTSDLITRVWQHKQDFVAGFTKQYQIHRLVFYELHADMQSAIAREKQIKKWERNWKIELIEKDNSDWCDLYLDLINQFTFIRARSLPQQMLWNAHGYWPAGLLF